MSRHRRYVNYYERFSTACGQYGAPLPPSAGPQIHSTPLSSPVFLEKLKKHLSSPDVHGVLAAVGAWTIGPLLRLLKNKECVIIVNKAPMVKSLRAQYEELGCATPRSLFPGKVVPFLFRKSFGGTLKNDYGCTEGVRLIGVDERGLNQTDNKSIFHEKIIILFRINEKTLKVEPFAVYYGGANVSYAAAGSLSHMSYTEDSKAVDYFYQWWAHVLSLSEPLNQWDRSISPEFCWVKSRKHKKAPQCAECGGYLWIAPLYEDCLAFRCADCGTQHIQNPKTGLLTPFTPPKRSALWRVSELVIS